MFSAGRFAAGRFVAGRFVAGRFAGRGPWSRHMGNLHVAEVRGKLA